jgi:HlyD family secretion protein
MHRSFSRRKLIVGAAVLAVAVLAVCYVWLRPADAVQPIPGVVRATEIHVAAEVSGHLERVLVHPGQSVQQGEPLALLSNPELWAAVAEARAQVDKAASDRDRVYAGVRQEQVQSLQREILKAQAVQTLARQELSRTSQLAARSDASLQDLDNARAEAARADADVAVAQARYAEAQLGPSAEERALADAQVKAAEAARDVVEARAAKMLLRAPEAGEIGLIVPEIGEAIVPGEPILTLLPKSGFWFAFNLREDALGQLGIGSRATIGMSGQPGLASAVLTELRNWGEFAAWRAARASGDHDLNTFFLRLDPVAPAPSLAAGQTIWLRPS